MDSKGLRAFVYFVSLVRSSSTIMDPSDLRLTSVFSVSSCTFVESSDLRFTSVFSRYLLQLFLDPRTVDFCLSAVSSRIHRTFVYSVLVVVPSLALMDLSGLQAIVYYGWVMGYFLFLVDSSDLRVYSTSCQWRYWPLSLIESSGFGLFSFLCGNLSLLGAIWNILALGLCSSLYFRILYLSS